MTIRLCHSSFSDQGLALRWRFGACWFFRGERRHKSLPKIIDVLEILNRIFLCLSEYAGADQIKNHVPNVFAGTNSPIVENRHDQRSELLERVLPHASEQLGSRHMPDRGPLDFLLLFCREIERVAQKNVRVPLVARVAGHDRIKGFGKSNLLHE